MRRKINKGMEILFEQMGFIDSKEREEVQVQNEFIKLPNYEINDCQQGGIQWLMMQR